MLSTGATDVPEASITALLDRHPAAARSARIWTRDALHSWGVPPGVTEDVELVITELVSNSLIHATGGIRARLVLLRGPREVRLEVHDGGPAPAQVPREPGTGGRGLVITAALTERCGWEMARGRTTAWATLHAA
ncbi:MULTISPECIES: ATP-binding protein [Streptomyces]|uniref:ATP-binding protein n=1 Tax=Streptomyces TaxID=1883 RepID=UPI00039FDC7A|nr:MULTISPECIES: ATP-binding protein [Streptomyces]MBZ6128530.1 ATP-binding protein [Streptomyces olivaceus]MBZ6128773.1 ATP-binding protein [Streptomyces olivaceus]MBZ6162882.1 ATP-binding protein [Streptomyces olivaceus]MBZ6190685.1 ATP-binding protein [Streptomyces olivaceus]MBZ6212050.1 ATP-binding protein [Streptomyces olivaceus]